jgi:hypothetical protein
MSCLFCEWEMGLGGTVDPAEVVCAFEDHLDDHLVDLLGELDGYLA